jgi:serpin B
MARSLTLGLFTVLTLPCCGGLDGAPQADGSTPRVDGSAPRVDGSTPRVDGSAAQVDTLARPANEIRSAQPRNMTPTVAPEDATQLAADNLAFGVDLYDQLRAQNTGNIIFSQTSISLALAMQYAGAANQTAAQMATTLHFTLPPERLHPAFDALDLALTKAPAGASPDQFQLVIANSTWVQTGYSFLTSYLDLLAENYDAGLFAEDFLNSADAARADINRWVSDQTQQKIPELLDPGAVMPTTRLVLADAVFFHGTWATGFLLDASSGTTFHTPTGDKSVSMMWSKGNNATLWGASGWTAARLAYLGATASMILLVPDAGTFDAFEQGLTADRLATMLSPSTAPMAGIVYLPRFKLATPSPLAGALAALGMTDAFDPALADFSGMNGAHDLFITAVIHKAIIEVNEAGTTAAAATGTTTGVLIVIDQPGETLVVDRPFLFFVRHDATGAMLFQGRVLDPSQE